MKLTASPIRGISLKYPNIVVEDATLTDGATPVRVTTEHARFRVPWPVIDLVALAVHVNAPRLVLVLLG